MVDIIFSPEEDISKIELNYGLIDTSPELEETQLLFLKALKNLLIMGITQNVLVRVSNELRRTRKKISSLKNIFIPNYEETIKHIEFSLEEKERYELAIHKILKNKLRGE